MSIETPALNILRVVLILHALAVFTQAALAGRFLSGEDSAVVFHEVTGWAIAGVCLVQTVVAIALKGAPLWFVVSSIATFLGEGLQVGTGYGRFLNVHIPLSILIVSAVMGQIFWAFGGRARS